MDEKNPKCRSGTGKTGCQGFLAEAASDAAYPSGRSSSGNVPVDKLLGFCDLFCCDRRCRSDRKYYSI